MLPCNILQILLFFFSYQIVKVRGTSGSFCSFPLPFQFYFSLPLKVHTSESNAACFRVTFFLHYLVTAWHPLYFAYKELSVYSDLRLSVLNALFLEECVHFFVLLPT